MGQITQFNGSTTVAIGLPNNSFSDLSGAVATGQLPSGIPVQAAIPVNLIAQAANIGSTPVVAVATSGFYRITARLVRTQIATTSSTAPSLTITWTDGDNSAAGSSVVIATNATNTLVAGASAELIIWVKAGSIVNFSTTGYVSSGATPMQYAVHIKSEAL